MGGLRGTGKQLTDTAQAAVRSLMRSLGSDVPGPEAQIAALAALQRGLQQGLTLEELLQRVVGCAAELLGTPRVNIRLLDPSRTRLMAACRYGEPLHWNADASFELGEGLIGWIALHQAPIRIPAAERDPRFQRRADQKERVGSYLGMPLMSGQVCVGVLSATHPTEDTFLARDEDLMALLAGLCAPHVEVARLSRLAQTDPLTGTLNRRGLAQILGSLPDDDGQALSVVMVDVDHFKKVNDTHGHGVGDEVLIAVANVLSGVLRPSDVVVRYGGEEFLMLLPGVDVTSALRIAERARAAVASARVHEAGGGVRVSVSMGAAERKAGEPRTTLIQRADAALYAAKESGRNRVVIATE